MGKQAREERKGKDTEPRKEQDQGLSAEDKRFAGTLEYLARGIILGGSLGAIAGWFFMDFGRAIGLGLLAGCLAGVTMKNMNDRKRGR